MNLVGWMVDTITVRSQGSVGADGDPSFGTSRTVKARVQAEKDRDETEIVHTHVVYTATAIQPDDEIMLAGESVWRRPAKVSSTHDRARTSTLVKVLL